MPLDARQRQQSVRLNLLHHARHDEPRELVARRGAGQVKAPVLYQPQTPPDDGLSDRQRRQSVQQRGPSLGAKRVEDRADAAAQSGNDATSG
jgi:hypothetical protein